MLKNSFWALIGQGARIALQALLFFVLARGLGVGEFGSYMTIFAYAQILFPIAGLGTHNTMIMRVARRPKLLNRYLGTPLIGTLLLGSVLALLATVCIYALNSQPGFTTILFVLLTELVAFRLLDVVTHAWQAIENLRQYALTYMLLSMTRLGLAASLWWCGLLHLNHWAMSNLLLTLIITAIVFRRLFSMLQLQWRVMRFFSSEFREGFYFSLSGVGQAMYGNLDKIILSNLLGNEAVGIYAVAQRMIQMAFLPVSAVFQAAYPKYFQAGLQGLVTALEYSRKMAPILLGYGCFVWGANYLISSYVPWIFGEQYTPSIKLLKIMAVVPLIQVAYYLLGEPITGCGKQRARSLLQLFVACVSVIILYQMISYKGLYGTAWAVMVVEMLMLLVSAGFVKIYAKR